MVGNPWKFHPFHPSMNMWMIFLGIPHQPCVKDPDFNLEKSFRTIHHGVFEKTGQAVEFSNPPFSHIICPAVLFFHPKKLNHHQRSNLPGRPVTCCWNPCTSVIAVLEKLVFGEFFSLFLGLPAAAVCGTPG